MPEQADITIAKLRNHSNLDDSVFFALYLRLVKNEPLSNDELRDLLRFAIIFLRSSDDLVARFGYRIILQYGEVTRDYEPLHSVAQSRDLIPVVAAAERLDPELASSETFARNLFAAHSVNFLTEEQDGGRLLRTRGQMELRAFNAREHEAIVVAPTSYGKSEMLIEKIAQNLDAITCVLVPTRALISQTRALVIADRRIREAQVRVLTHPDSYTDERHFIAVMTQERLHRLLVEQPTLRIDQLLVDEAHNLLASDSRALELSQVVLTARSRNSALAVTYYTPFMSEPESIRHVNEVDVAVRARAVNEHVKSERITFAQLGGSLHLYDQFLNRPIDLEIPIAADEVAAIIELAELRTLVYVNRPRDAQDLARRLSEQSGQAEISTEAQRAIRAIADLIDPNYSLIRAIESGVLFHHGQVPDVLRQYIERLFRDDSSTQPRLLVTTSTLLEGVNTPADCLILMTPSRGRRNLSRSAFRNLIGRVARFREVFDTRRRDLDLLQPRIHLLRSSYARADWNIQNFLSNVANLANIVEDNVDNPLLERSEDVEGRREALEYLENIEPGSSQLPNPRIASTEVGKLCFQNGIRDFDILGNESAIQTRVETARAAQRLLAEPSEVVDAICELFLNDIELDDTHPLGRVRDSDGAREFYKMFISWRSQNEPYKRLISRFVRYWSQLDEEYVFVGSKWGEETYGPNGVRKLYVRMGAKSRVEMINLAVAKIKEEQDFVDFHIVKYIEIMNSLGLVERDLYNRIKFGTADPFLICLLRNGFSPELARLVLENYSDVIAVDVATSDVTVTRALSEMMSSNGENDILIYEAETLVNSELLR